MRDQLLARIQLLVEVLAEQLADMLLERFEQHMNQLELAFDAASSAFASDLERTNQGGEVADAAAKQTPPTPSVAPASGEASPSTRRRPLDPPVKKSKRTCGCGPIGRHRKGCNLSTSTTANTVETPVSSSTSTSPAPRDSAPRAVAAPSATSPIPREDRFAEIEAAKARREQAKRDREARAASFVKPRPERAPRSDDAPALEPGVVATFEF